MNLWKFVCATDADVSRWSSGTVVTVEELYSSQIFGAKQSLRCDCGKLSGVATVGRLCSNCRVWVVEDAVSQRKRAFGKARLACHWQHPTAVGWLTLFPIAPIAFRIGDDGEPTTIGRKYEEVVRVNQRLVAELPAPNTPSYYDAGFLDGHADLTTSLNNLLGVFGGRGRAVLNELEDLDTSLMGLLHRAISRMDEDIASYARACCVSLKMSATI